jgi:quercetin dioxygenase-like cupin family protein
LLETIRKTRRHHRVVPSLAGLLALTIGLSVGLTAQGEVAAQEPPPAPRVTGLASRNFTDAPRQYDLVQALLEFAPGAATPWHRVAGRGMFTVISGEITRVEENGEKKVFKAGETFTESPEDHWDYDANLGTAPARLLATFALIPGTEPLIIHPDLPFPGTSAPQFVAQARTTVGIIPAQFTLVHGIIELPGGFVAGPHTHDAWNMATGISGGSVTNRVDGIAHVHSPPAVFVHGPGQVHEAIGGAQASTAMFASLGPTGAPPSRTVGAVAAQTPAIRPPATGDGGLAD